MYHVEGSLLVEILNPCDLDSAFEGGGDFLGYDGDSEAGLYISNYGIYVVD